MLKKIRVLHLHILGRGVELFYHGLVQWNVFDSIGDTSYEEASDFSGRAAGVQHGWLPLRPLAVARTGPRDVGDYLPDGMPAQRGH